MGKSIALLASVLLSVMANAASAVEARDCEAQASRMKVAERAGFLTACMERLGAPENVRQAVLRKRKGACERNAKNLSLRDEFRSRYVGICIERNDAALAYADAGRRGFRIYPELAAATETKKPAPVVSIPQKKLAKGKNGKLRTRQASAATCKEG
jgi:hypothetical protein